MTERETVLREIGRRMAAEETRIPGLDTVFLTGTIVSCSFCEEGLYRVAQCATTADLILDDGTLLKPLNLTIPARDVWQPLACVKCGGRVYKDGKMYTLQYGWH